MSGPDSPVRVWGGTNNSQNLSLFAILWTMDASSSGENDFIRGPRMASLGQKNSRDTWRTDSELRTGNATSLMRQRKCHSSAHAVAFVFCGVLQRKKGPRR